jgi:hypothetical protein
MVKSGMQRVEYERQEKTLNELPKNFKYPLFNGWQAIQSQRKSGYKTTARAAREIVDNAIEAGAENVWITFDLLKDEDRKSHQRKNTVTAVAFIDDGPGMVHHSDEKSMLRYALSWGGGTHFDAPELIGKFGFGLPNSSVNQTQLTEVYTCTESDDGWNKVVLDIRRQSVPPTGEVHASKVVKAELPNFVQNFLKREKITLKTGTVVVWCNPDRLTVNQRATLREHLEHDFQIVYRGLLDRIKIYVDSKNPVFKVDPTFLDPDGWLYVPQDQGGAECLYDESLLVKHYFEEDSGQPRLELVGPEKGKDPVTGYDYDLSLEEAKEQQANPPAGQRDVGLSTLRVRVAYLPYPDFMRREKRKVESDRGRRFEIRKRSRGISFVRSGREIDTRDVFPTENRKETGSWPLLQAYAYYWALEVQFDPGLDDAMGIGHDKQTVEPIVDFWAVLTRAAVPEALARASGRRRDEGVQELVKRRESKEADTPSEEAAEQAAKMEKPIAPGSKKSQQQKEEANKKSDRDSASQPTPDSSDAGDSPSPPTPMPRPPRFKIEHFEAEGGVFMEPVSGINGQVIARVNRKHPWFDAYANPGTILEARNAVNLLLFALATAEIRADDEKQAFLEGLRCDEINPFLRKTVRLMKMMLPPKDEDDE